MGEIRIIRRLHKVRSLDEVKLQNNMVLLSAVYDNLDTPTKSGLLKASRQFQKDQYLAPYANRVYKVVKVCHALTFWTPTNKTSGTALRWKTEIEIQEGDAVWVSYPSVIDYDAIVCGGEEYLVVNYSELRLAKRGDETIMLNGWVLYEHPQISRSTILYDPNPEKDLKRGIVLLTGRPNDAYVVNDKKWVDIDSTVDLKVGDVFIKDNPAHQLILEDPLFQYYASKNVFVIQRRNIVVVC